jgi:predicted enzyme related to lactoylglutathione lyase
MRGAVDDVSTVFDRSGMGKCNWNELITTDQASANAFYAAVFGWTYPDKMTMPPPLGDYWFVNVGDTTLGATMQNGEGYPGSHLPPGWRFFFRAADIEAAAAKVTAAGGTVLMGPNAVPGGDRIILATDPHGVAFGVVGPGDAA